MVAGLSEARLDDPAYVAQPLFRAAQRHGQRRQVLAGSLCKDR
jgi:hypothetical protein